MHHVNVRGTFITSKMCIPYLRKSAGGGRILNNSPPLVMDAKWFAPHVAYTMTKFGMSMCALGMAEEVGTRLPCHTACYSCQLPNENIVSIN